LIATPGRTVIEERETASAAKKLDYNERKLGKFNS
jgi:hypothetical protein